MEEVKYIQGDLVKLDGRLKVIVRPEDFGFRVRDIETNLITLCTIENVEPIQLAPAILEANGFKKCKFGDGYCIINRPTFSIFLEKEDDKNLIITLGGATLMHCNFVHELQHFLFGLGLNSELKV